jgi:hypothetical protein
MTLARTHTRTTTVICPANPFLACCACNRPVDFFSHTGEREGPSRNEPCGHAADYRATRDWNPVDGPTNDRCPEK